MNRSLPRVRVEFYGLARLRAGQPGFMVEAGTVGAALAAVEAVCPDLKVVLEGRVSPFYLVSVRGEQFTTELSQSLGVGDCLIIFGADAGG